MLAKVLDYVCKGAAKLGVRTMAGVVDAKLHQDGYTPLLGIDDAAACQHSFELGEGAALDRVGQVDAHHGGGGEHVGKSDIGLLGRPVKERAWDRGSADKFQGTRRSRFWKVWNISKRAFSS